MKRIILQLGKLVSVRFLAIGLTLLQTIVLTRVFGPETFGKLSFALSISALAVLVLSFGLDQLMMRDIARVGRDLVAGTHRWSSVWKLVRRFLIPLVLSVTMLTLGLLLFTDIGNIYTVPLVGIAVMVPVVLARKFIEAMALGAKQVVRSLVGTQIAYPGLMAAGALTVWILGADVGILNATMVYIVATVGSLCIAFLLVHRIVHSIRNSDAAGNELTGESPTNAALLSSGMHFAMISLGFVIGQHMAVLLTGFLAGPEEVSLVRIASRVAEMAGIIRAIALLQYRPLLAEAHGQRDKGLLQKHSKILVIIFTATGLPITVGLWIFADQAMSVFGEEFVSGAWAMRLYVLSIFCAMICGPSNALLAMTDSEGAASRALMMMLVAQFFLDLLLIPPFGAVGAASAQLVSLVLLSIYSAYLAWKRTGVNTTVLSILFRN